MLLRAWAGRERVSSDRQWERGGPRASTRAPGGSDPQGGHGGTGRPPRQHPHPPPGRPKAGQAGHEGSRRREGCRAGLGQSSMNPEQTDIAYREMVRLAPRARRVFTRRTRRAEISHTHNEGAPAAPWERLGAAAEEGARKILLERPPPPALLPTSPPTRPRPPRRA